MDRGDPMPHPVLTWVLCALLVAGGAPVRAQQGRKPFNAEDAAQLLRGAPKRGIERTAKGTLLKGDHCGRDQARTTWLLKGQTGVVAEDELLVLFDRILCARTGEAGEVAVDAFGDAAADPFASGVTRYSGELEIGEWEPGLEYRDPRKEASVSYVGLMLARLGVSLWEVTTPDSVRVWYAPFRVAPSVAVTFFFEHRGGRWVWTGASSATRI